MKILGIDTSSMAASVAVIEDNKLICEYTINTKKTHSQKLMPMIENMLGLSDLNVREIDAIAVCEGPGSFTGLRIGMATAKAIAHVNDIPVIGVNSLEALAANMNLCDKKICSILDAQRNQVYTGRYQYEGTKLVEIKEIGIQQIDELLEELAQSGEQWILVGEAVYKYEDKIREISNIEIPAASNNVTKAGSLCSVAKVKFDEGKDIFDCYTVNPLYIRKSQAEEQYEEKQRKLEAERKLQEQK
ncbi:MULTISPECIES: tRNA (adenosine(37)-N6)-threonylcarbamoyltransferase complex dimerization subunit type 1 TsaB [Clostridia]|jgi:tRNA threonylcarbamoyladenosine biosynthesis protein TsaB|uniref:tRNA (adenosine(37)-N6)-threonylcarbamoyltransferase complex dimerization subunit type 1 TsaB n=1 Tax=Clostridia TaxID=186801 RepID=UPI0018A9BA47|nr:tRNA (adenosine(37)-N6)-threonylcarbamoyltransferase complex dimerization subunit type 1 TsaB [Clostridium sp. 1001270J_160509_D11]